MTCPQCQTPMEQRILGFVSVNRCPGCRGLFLDRSALGALVEAENDWHAHQSANTAAMPRITPEMAAPPSQARSRAYIETLFGA